MIAHDIPGQSLILFVGSPGGGKSTVAELLKPHLKGICHWDIDDVRALLFGKPPGNDGTDPVIAARDALEMAGSYDALFGYVEAYLHAERPLMLTCTLSHRVHGQQRLENIYLRYREARVRIIWCYPEITIEQLRERFAGRAASGYIGDTPNPERAWELRQKFHPIELPHLKLDTGPGNTPEDSVAQALGYILATQPHDGMIVG
jgi:predicted kinase